MQLVNAVRKRLREGQLAVGFGVNHSRLISIVEVAQSAGFHWLFLDMEHGQYDLELVSQMSVAALYAGMPTVVRVPGPETFHTGRVLDGGATGVIVPHVESAEAANQVVWNCRFPPLGTRSMPGTLVQLGSEKMAPAAAIKALNEYILVVVMIETPSAVAHADEIAAVPGVDVLLIGSMDLTCAMGIPGQFEHPDLLKVYQEVIGACRARGKAAGMGGIYQEDVMKRYIELGAQFILGGSDLAFMKTAAFQRIEFLKQLERVEANVS